jgi:predicted enzyme related to lactoylglutathione lyase
MPVVTSYPQGAPCWFELATSDQKGANAFYSTLFGWSVKDTPISDNETYSMYKLGGNDVAACYTLMADMVAQGIPPHWMVYFSVDSADASASRVTELGGSVKAPPFDVFEYGRMSVCADPEGAVFSLWQPKAHVGATLAGDINTVCWSELLSRDTREAAEFYTGLFGWTTRVSPEYTEFSVGGQERGGLLRMDEQWQGIPAHWALYIRVDDCDKTVARIKELGGSVKHGPFDAANVGRMAVVADPQGAVFSIIRLTNM